LGYSGSSCRRRHHGVVVVDLDRAIVARPVALKVAVEERREARDHPVRAVGNGVEGGDHDQVDVDVLAAVVGIKRSNRRVPAVAALEKGVDGDLRELGVRL